jgi:hypothetical protein
LHWAALAENVAGIVAIGSVRLPGGASQSILCKQIIPILIAGVPYLHARDICVTELPKRFWKVQYPLLNLLKTRRIGVDFEGANIPWRGIELNRSRTTRQRAHEAGIESLQV